MEYYAQKCLCSNHSVRKTSGYLILNLILASWKVIDYSKKDQTEDLYFYFINYISLKGIRLTCFEKKQKLIWSK